MALAKLTDIQKIARDCYRGNVEKYSKNAANEVLRAEIIERVGGEWNYTNFQKNKWDVYALIQEIISVDLVNLSEDVFKDFCKVKRYDLGDLPEFVVKNNELFKVAVIADGINSTRRQRKLGSRVNTTSFKLAISTYEELDRFIAGRIDWVDYVDTVVASLNHEIATQISNTFAQAYTDLSTNLKTSTNIDGFEDELKTMINKVKGATGKPVAVYGTAEALGRITGVGAVADLNDRRELGYLQIINGVKMVELPNTYDASNDEWALRNDILYVIPSGDDIIQLGYEGGVTILEDTDGTKRDDQQIELTYMQKVHLCVLVAAKFGAVELID
jgi:hypothetical protein